VSNPAEGLLPHRPPFLWIDDVVELEPGVRCVAGKTLSPSEPVFAGHFPGDPILPGVLLIEAAAQAAGVMIASARTERPGRALLAAVHHFKFLKSVRPGDSIQIETTLKLEALGMAVVSVSVRVAGNVVATGEISVVTN
jgi:3-hydroxyacyl-[acyl-carrier-protein] dehydratase